MKNRFIKKKKSYRYTIKLNFSRKTFKDNEKNNSIEIIQFNSEKKILIFNPYENYSFSIICINIEIIIQIKKKYKPQIQLISHLIHALPYYLSNSELVGQDSNQSNEKNHIYQIRLIPKRLGDSINRRIFQLCDEIYLTTLPSSNHH